MICRNCGEQLFGDGYQVAYRCPNIGFGYEDREPDADPVYCDGTESGGLEDDDVGP